MKKKLNDKQKAILLFTGAAAISLGTVAYIAHSVGFVAGHVCGTNAEIAKQTLRELIPEVF